jgi:hypothetical protein
MQRALMAKTTANGPQGHAKGAGTVDPPDDDQIEEDSSGWRGTVIGQ